MCQIHLQKLRVALSGKDKLPRDFACEKEVEVIIRQWDREKGEHASIGVYAARVIPTPEPAPVTEEYKRWYGKSKSSQHRVFLKCKCCGKFVPAGRLMQHLRAADHEEAAKEFGLTTIKQMREAREARKYRQSVAHLQTSMFSA